VFTKSMARFCALGLLFCWIASSARARPQNLRNGDSPAAILFRSAQRDAAAGRYEEAVKEYRHVLQIDPTLIEARVNLGLAYHSLGQYRSAIAELEKVVREQPDLVGANLFLGIDYLKEKLPQKAVFPLQRVLRAEPSNREARRALAASSMGLEQYAQAAEEFRTLASTDPDEANALYELGQNYLDLAKQLADRMSQTDPDSAWAKRLAGDLLAASARWTDAAVIYREALAADPRQGGLHTSLGNMYLRQGKLHQATEEFQADLRLDANNEQALLGLAEAQLVNSELAKSVESLSRIAEIYPPFLNQQADFPLIALSADRAANAAMELEAASETPGKHFLLASLYRIAGDEERAQQQWQAWQKDSGGQPGTRTRTARDGVQPCQSHQYEACADRLLSRDDLDSSGQLLLGKTLFSLGRYVEAASRFDNVLLSDEKRLEPRYWLARGDMKLADASLGRLVQYFPASWRAHEFIGISDQLRDLDDDAIREFQAAAKTHPDDPELHQRLGELFYTKKSFARAEEELRKAIELDPGHTRSLYLLGRVYLEQHQTAQSVPYFQAALQRNPGLLEAHAGLGQAYVRSGQPDLAVKELQKAASIDKYGDLHYLLYVAYHKLGKEDLARQALGRSQELRKHTAALHQARVSEASEEERRK